VHTIPTRFVLCIFLYTARCFFSSHGGPWRPNFFWCFGCMHRLCFKVLCHLHGLVFGYGCRREPNSIFSNMTLPQVDERKPTLQPMYRADKIQRLVFAPCGSQTHTSRCLALCLTLITFSRGGLGGLLGASWGPLGGPCGPLEMSVHGDFCISLCCGWALE